MKTFVIAKVLVVNEAGEVLSLVRSKTDIRRPGELDFPGGMVDPGEEMSAAAIRETSEEAGLSLSSVQLIFGLSDLTEYGSGTWLVFAAHVPGTPVITLSHEHDAYEWMQPEELFNRLTYDRQRKMLRYAIDNDLLRQEQSTSES